MRGHPRQESEAGLGNWHYPKSESQGDTPLIGLLIPRDSRGMRAQYRLNIKACLVPEVSSGRDKAEIEQRQTKNSPVGLLH